VRSATTLLVASCGLVTGLACESAGGPGSSLEEGGDGEAVASAGPDGGGNDSDGESSEATGTLAGSGVCRSKADCADSGAGLICCLGSSFTSVCVRFCPFTSFGSYQLCASAAECARPGQTYCGPFRGTWAGLMVCGQPPPPQADAGD
jgi:hypothetical protein